MKKSIKLISALVATLGFAAAAHAEVVVIVNAANPTASLTTEQVGNIFLGKITEVPGAGAASPYDLPESSSLREEFYTKTTQKSAAQVKAYWSKQVFTGKGYPPKEVGNSAEVKKGVASNPGGIGYIEKSAVDGSVKAVLTLH
ncbi:hypothetical protein B9N43_15230 [Denitratisoma sp. DHT3]|uniref:substrate-binding domain-containing protein n=1 Tax=Denitratisoma sp. DHT3 TaxID=1981880 RepID=UPI0011988AF7|nr:substrate-binding domain-containing protein [Denitratisoma sp. DHT3]QDX82469.1 hypothetical protein B9N43_15230 [Denitratisoma sp. DHT3]